MNSLNSERKLLIKRLETAGWVFTRTARGYPKGKCPCGEHMKMIHLSPSDPHYYRNCEAELRRSTCWNG